MSLVAASLNSVGLFCSVCAHCLPTDVAQAAERTTRTMIGCSCICARREAVLLAPAVDGA